MGKASLVLATVAVSTTTRMGRAVGAYEEVRGRAAPLSTDEAASYAVMNCAQMCGECAEVWCDDGEVSGCTPGTRQVVRVADQCASTCGDGDLVLSRDVFLGISGANSTWIPVNWSCVACDSSSAGAGGGDIDSRDIEASCPGNGDRINASLVVAEGFSSAQSAANESIGDPVGSSGDASLDGIAYPVSTNNDTSGSSDEEIKEPEAASSSDSGGGSVDTSAKSSSKNAINGTSDVASTSDGGDSVWSSSGSASTNPWNEQGQKTAPPMPYTPRVSPSTALSASSSGASSSSQTFGPTSTNSPAITPTATSTLPSIATSTPEPAKSGTTTTDFPAATLAGSVGNSQDGDSVNMSSTASASTSAPVTVKSPPQTSGSSDQSSGDGSLSATSTVTKSPFFYASIVLAIVGIIGAVVGYRAKRMRSHRDEERNYRTSTRAATPASTPSSPTNLGRVQFNDHHIVVL